MARAGGHVEVRVVRGEPHRDGLDRQCGPSDLAKRSGLFTGQPHDRMSVGERGGERSVGEQEDVTRSCPERRRAGHGILLEIDLDDRGIVLVGEERPALPADTSEDEAAALACGRLALDRDRGRGRPCGRGRRRRGDRWRAATTLSYPFAARLWDFEGRGGWYHPCLGGFITVTFSRAFRSPFVRIPFLAFAVIATVATSQPEWDVEARPVDEGITLTRGASVERKIGYEGSHDVRIRSELSGSAPSGTRIRIQHTDPNGAPDVDAGGDGGSAETGGLVRCSADATYESKEPGKWVRVYPDGQLADWSSSTMSADSSCKSKSGTTIVKVTNEGGDELKLHLTIRAIIGGVGDDTPDGAFVRAQVVQ